MVDQQITNQIQQIDRFRDTLIHSINEVSRLDLPVVLRLQIKTNDFLHALETALYALNKYR